MKMFELVSWFQMEYPEIVRSMKRSDHHLVIATPVSDGMVGDPINLNPYHLESDVFTHTMMVCKQAENMPYEVQIAALLHDIGKPATRAVNPKNGRVSFFNHDAVSAFMSLEILKRKELGLSKEQQVLIFNAIALHTQVYKQGEAFFVNHIKPDLRDVLIQLGKADHEGRFHSHEGSVIPDQYLYSGVSSTRRLRKTDKEVIIFCGLPASGKSSYLEQFDDITGAFRVSRDDCILVEAMLRDTKPYSQTDYNTLWKNSNQKDVDRLLQERFKESKKHNLVTVDMTHMSKKSRRRSLSHFGNDYKKKCVVFLTDLHTLEERNSNREGKVIPQDVIDRMMRSFYPPTYEEFDEIEYIIS